MGTAIVRRIGAGKKILLGDISEKTLDDGGSYLLFFKGKRIGKSEKMSAKCINSVLRIFRFFAFKISHQNEITYHHHRSLGDIARSLHTEDRNET